MTEPDTLAHLDHLNCCVVDSDFDDELPVLDLFKHEIADAGAVGLHPDACDDYERVPLVVRHHLPAQHLAPSVWVDEDQASADVTHLPARVKTPPFKPPPFVAPQTPRLCDCLPGQTGVPGWRRARVCGDKVMIRVEDEHNWHESQRAFLREIARDDQVILYKRTDM